MKDYTLTETKEILQKYFGLLPQIDVFANNLCQQGDCEKCLFKNGVHCDRIGFFDPEMIAKAEQYVKDHEKKMDWNKVPAGTPVLCWQGNNIELAVKRLFLADMGCKLWAVDGNNLDVAHAWEHMKLDPEEVMMKEEWIWTM